MRTVAIITTSRADYGIYRPIIAALRKYPQVEVRLLVTGMHLSPEFGYTVSEIEADAVPIAARVETLLSSDTPQGVGAAMGLTVIKFSQLFASSMPDILVVLGDRFEMFAAALAAAPYQIPIAHVHGGEVTHGAIDDMFRHGLTKMAHLHFVSTARYGKRIEQLGEEAWRITVSGAPALDHLAKSRVVGLQEVYERIGLVSDAPPLLVTLHPETVGESRAGVHADMVAQALAGAPGPIVITASNADAGGRRITQRLERLKQERSDVVVVKSVGAEVYASLMAHAYAMLGNSSSGIIEAASFKLPVINIGTRQDGREKPANVIDVDWDVEAIRRTVDEVRSPSFRGKLSELVSPYGDGRAGDRISQRLATEELGGRLLSKRFVDLA